MLLLVSHCHRKRRTTAKRLISQGLDARSCNRKKRSETVLCLLRIRRLQVQILPDAPLQNTLCYWLFFTFKGTALNQKNICLATYWPLCRFWTAFFAIG